MLQVTIAKAKPAVREEVPAELQSMTQQCFSFDPHDRPNAMQVHRIGAASKICSACAALLGSDLLFPCCMLHCLGLGTNLYSSILVFAPGALSHVFVQRLREFQQHELWQKRQESGSGELPDQSMDASHRVP